MIKNIKVIEEALGLEEGKLVEMVKDEAEHELDFTPAVIEKKNVYEERVENLKKSSAQMAKETTIKEIKKKTGLEFEGKNEEAFVTAFKAHETKIKEEVIKDPEQRYVKLKEDFEKLQGNLTKKDEEIENLKTTFTKEKETGEIKNAFFSNIEIDTVVSKNTIFTEAKEKGFDFVKEEGKVVIKKDGETLKDEKTLSPIGLDTWVKDFVTPYAKKKQEGGGGGDDETNPSKAGSFEAFEKEAEKEGWDDTKKNAEMQKRIKDKTLVI